ncbi:MAG: glycosyltransferase family 1 protein, partial [Kiritimatiellae bacterium]|nr:glycosyltransferase family 1 protein [Kiritimatiellia bacterium]
VAGDAAAVVPAGDPAAFADAAVAILRSPERQEEMRRLGRLRAARFTWETTARETLALYRAVLEEGGRK